MNQLYFKRTGLVVAAVLLTFSTTAFANTIPAGNASITGEVDIFANASCVGCASGPGIYFFNGNDSVSQGYDAGSTSAANGSFNGLLNGNGTLAGGILKNLLGAPVTGADSIVDEASFITNIGEIQFDLTQINAGTGTNAGCTNVIGSVCTPTGSPFTLTQQGANGNGNVCDPTNPSDACAVSITLNLAGKFYQVSNTAFDQGGVAFTAQATAPGTTTQVLAAVASTTGLVDQTFSASLTAVPPASTPEPATFLMILSGLGLLGIGSFGRVRKI